MSHPEVSSIQFTRRQMLQTAAVTAAGVWVGSPVQAAAKANVASTSVISRQPQFYAGWPTVVRRADGQLAVVWSGGREAHVCPFGRVDWIVSYDDGETWSWPRTLLDSATDDRDAGILETDKGTLLVTTFTSEAWEAVFKKNAKDWDPARRERWEAVRRRLSDEQRHAELGQWMIRSTDGGLSWSERYRVPVSTPHGPVQLADGRQMYAGVGLWDTPRRVGVAESSDDGVTWTFLADIPPARETRAEQYHELHMVESASGRLVAQIRNHNKQNHGETLQSHSDDGGKTWAVPYSIGVWGYPSHLLRLKDDRLLMTYGYRRKPFGTLARLSDDDGRTWSEPLTISDDAPSGDLGYPSSVQLGDGSLLTVWYERMADTPSTVLRQAKWRLEE